MTYTEVDEIDPVTGEKTGKKTRRLNQRSQLLLVCICCFCCLPLVILGVVGFARELNLRRALDEHRYSVDMDGCKERPLGGGNPASCPGDPNGSGFGVVIVETRGKEEVCVDIIVDFVGAATGLHIHGPLTVTDPQVAAIFVPEDGSSFDIVPIETATGERYKSCRRVSDNVAKAIVDNPHLFYANFHTAAFPNGALRDSLGNGQRKNT